MWYLQTYLVPTTTARRKMRLKMVVTNINSPVFDVLRYSIYVASKFDFYLNTRTEELWC